MMDLLRYLKKELYGAMEQVLTTKKLGEEFKQKVLNEVKGVAYTYVKVTNIGRSVQWYEANLGCAVKSKNDGYACLRLPWGPQLELVLGEVTSDSIVFGLYAPNIESYYSLLKENEVKLDEMIDEGDCGLLFNIYDPDGNKIEVWGGYRGGGKGEVDNWIKSQQY